MTSPLSRVAQQLHRVLPQEATTAHSGDDGHGHGGRSSGGRWSGGAGTSKAASRAASRRASGNGGAFPWPTLNAFGGDSHYKKTKSAAPSAFQSRRGSLLSGLVDDDVQDHFEAQEHPFQRELKVTQTALVHLVEAEMGKLSHRLNQAMEVELTAARGEHYIRSFNRQATTELSNAGSGGAGSWSMPVGRICTVDKVSVLGGESAMTTLGSDLASSAYEDVHQAGALAMISGAESSEKPERSPSDRRKDFSEVKVHSWGPDDPGWAPGPPAPPLHPRSPNALLDVTPHQMPSVPSWDSDRSVEKGEINSVSDCAEEDVDRKVKFVDGICGEDRKRGSQQSCGVNEDGAHLSFEVLDCWKGDSRHIAAKLGNKNLRKLRTEDALSLAHMAENSIDIDSDSDSSSELGDTRRTEGCMQRFILHPNCPQRGVWEINSLLLVVYDIIWIPLQLLEPEENAFTNVMEWVTRLFWSADIGCSYLTGFVTTHGFVELRPKPIAKRYLRTWFTLDVIVVGVDWMEIIIASIVYGGAFRFSRAARALRIVRMVRLLRLLRIREMAKVLFESMHSETIKELADMISIFLMILVSGHIFACVWYGLGTSEIEPGSWVEQTFAYRHGLGYRYMASLHWSLSQYSGGMDEIRPANVTERIYVVVVLVFTLMVGTVLVSSLTSSMTQLSILANEKKSKLSMLRKYLLDNKISSRLCLRIQRNAEFSLVEQEMFLPEQSVELLHLLSEPLRIELHFELFARVLKHHPFFDEYIDHCPHIMQKVCHCAPKIMGVSCGDIVFNVGEIPPKPKMIMVTSGSLTYTPVQRGPASVAGRKSLNVVGEETVRSSSRVSVKARPSAGRVSRRSVFNAAASSTVVLEPGMWIAEAVLWTHWMHRGVLTASSDSRLCLLDAAMFQQTVTAFDHDEFNPKIYANHFVALLNAAQDLSDNTMLLEAEALTRLEKELTAAAEAKSNRPKRRASLAKF